MNVAIRQFRPEDAGPFESAVRESLDHLSPWLAWCTPEYSLVEAEEWAVSAAQAWVDGTDYRFLVIDADSGDILGGVGISQVVPEHRVGNLGYWVRKSAINSGVCTRAAELAAAFAFEKLGFQRLEIHILEDNHASIAVAEKLGAEFEGVFRNKLIHDGRSKPARCYALFPPGAE